MRLFISILLPVSVAHSDVISTGAGSYTTTRPDTIAGLPPGIFRRDSPQTPTPTNQWLSLIHI